MGIISEEIYNIEKEIYETISWEKTGDEEYYECENNECIHHIVDTNHGLLVRFLGNFYSQLIPRAKTGHKSGAGLLYYIKNLT